MLPETDWTARKRSWSLVLWSKAVAINRAGLAQLDTGGVHLLRMLLRAGYASGDAGEGVKAGGVDDGAPGPRPEYGGSYYSAYLRDPDGNRVEIAVHN